MLFFGSLFGLYLGGEAPVGDIDREPFAGRHLPDRRYGPAAAAHHGKSHAKDVPRRTALDQFARCGKLLPLLTEETPDGLPENLLATPQLKSALPEQPETEETVQAECESQESEAAQAECESQESEAAQAESETPETQA